MNREERICETAVTIGQVEDELKCTVSNGENSNLLEWEADRIGVGKGVASVLVRTKLKWNRQGLPTNLVLKIPSAKAFTGLVGGDKPDSDMQRKKTENVESGLLSITHDNETFMLKLLNERNVPIPHPKLFFGPGTEGSQTRCMGMGDLSQGAMQNVASGCNVAQTQTLMKAIAGLHAWSLKNPDAWEGRTMIFPRESIEALLEEIANKPIKKLPEIYPEQFPREKITVVMKYLNVKNYADLWTNTHNHDLGIPDVLIHGDMHTNNVFFEADENGGASDKLLAIIDWPLARKGNIMDDVIRVMLYCLGPGLRKENEKELLKHYFDEFASHFSEGAIPFSLEQVEKIYMKLFPYYAGMVLAGVTLYMGPQCQNINELKESGHLQKWLQNAQNVLDDIITLHDGGVFDQLLYAMELDERVLNANTDACLSQSVRLASTGLLFCLKDTLLTVNARSKMNREDNICETPVTIGQVEDELKKSVADGETAKILEWEAVRIGEGKGFASAVIKTSLKWSQSGLPTNLVLKVPTAQASADLVMDDSISTEDKQKKQERLDAHLVPIFHDNECVVMKLLMENDVPLPSPKFFFGPGGDRGRLRCLGMEDLSHGVSEDMLAGCNLAQAKNILDAIATLHAWSLQNKEAWKGKTKQFPKKWIGEVFGDLSDDMAKELPPLHPEYFTKEKVEIATKHFNAKNIGELWTKNHNIELGVPQMLIHGDVHIFNFLFKAGKDGKASDELLAMLDWQWSRDDNFMEDVGKVTLSCLAPGLRRGNEKALLMHYYESLASHFPGKEAPFSFATLEKDYFRFFPIQAGFVLAGLPQLLGPRSPLVANLKGEELKKVMEMKLEQARELLDDIITLDKGGVIWD